MSDINWHYDKPPNHDFGCIIEVDIGCTKESPETFAVLRTKIGHALWVSAADVFVGLDDMSLHESTLYVFEHDVIRWAELEPLKEEDLEW